jgi:hypothetical protein
MKLSLIVIFLGVLNVVILYFSSAYLSAKKYRNLIRAAEQSGCLDVADDLRISACAGFYGKLVKLFL